MDVTSIIVAMISTCGTIGVAIIGVRQHKEQKNATLREEGSLIQLEMAQASLNLAQCTAKAVMGHEVNGDMKEAMEWAKEVNVRFNEYSRRICQVFKEI
jgi:predicted benzoate:H+ symporter BenE